MMKRGSFDNYILRTDPKQLDSKFGLYLRSLMKQKLKNPQFKIPIIPGHAELARTTKTKLWEHNQMPAIYLPTASNLQVDRSEYYVKTPQEMSRYELAELEAEMRSINEGALEDDVLDEAQLKKLLADPEHQKLVQQLKKLQTLRHGVIKRYFDKFKFKKAHRNEIVQAAEETEDTLRGILRDEYVHFLDANPDMRAFLEQVNKDDSARV